MSKHSVDELFAEAEQLCESIETRERSVESDKWALAERLWRLNTEHGVPKKEIARRIGRSPKMVRNHIAVWEMGGGDAHPPRQPFTEVYYEVRGPEGSREGIADREARKVVRERPEVIAEAITKADPETQRKIADAIVRAEPEPSLRGAVAPPTPTPPVGPSAERQLGRATFTLWEVTQMLLDEVPAGEAKIRMLADAEKAERLAHGIATLLDTGEIDAQFSRLLDEVGADR